ncbi:MAG TPA: signal peptidase II [Thermoanaerobaculia bacterium]|nr:signal peptidase II [Thermoanaerobaculia bacterium]
MTPEGSRRGRGALLVALGLTVGADQLSKRVAERVLEQRGPIEVLHGAVRFQLAENRGAFLGLGDRLPGNARAILFVAAVGTMLAVALVFLLRARDWPIRRLVAAGLIVGGGVGNLIDRIARGPVTDFLQLRAGPLHTGIFNLADACILAGGAWLVLQSATGVHWKGRTDS